MMPALFALGGFLLGSIPFALLIGLARGVDIRTVGSKNPGATNLGRTIGFRWFVLCFLLDAGKGFAPTFVYGSIAGLTRAQGFPPADSFVWLGVMACPVLGHMFSPWIRFKGGKGVATGLGSLLGVYPMLTLPACGAFVVFGSILAIWRYVGLSSVLAAASLPLWVWYFFELLDRGVPDDAPVQPPARWPFLLVTVLLAGLVIYKHRGNLTRLAAGTEPKLGSGSRRPSENGGG
ncbi:MAG: glycerol-3-phosphate acyltransferase [Phycisphaeraceae bacterium]|nr:MAG: glycerol-3-phosphate acyltransferase [Phycisphaeraceae bacterium]